MGIEFKFISDHERYFEAAVTALLNAGWVLHGQPIVTVVDDKWYVSQALLRGPR